MRKSKRLTFHEKVEIRNLYLSGIPAEKIAKLYKVNVSSIFRNLQKSLTNKDLKILSETEKLRKWMKNQNLSIDKLEILIRKIKEPGVDNAQN